MSEQSKRPTLEEIGWVRLSPDKAGLYVLRAARTQREAGPLPDISKLSEAFSAFVVSEQYKAKKA